MKYEITSKGESEHFKGGVHLAMFGLAVAAGLYNIAACWRRPCPRLGFNVVVYSSLACLEAKQVLSHLEKRT
jgi:hypothetical protein